jgi:peptidase E
MKLFLASSLCFVSDIISSQIDLSWKIIWCIWNAADEDWGKCAERNQWDYEFFMQNKAIVVDIDLRNTINLLEILKTIDILFVWWWDALYLADLTRETKLAQYLPDFRKKWWVYCGTSAWSMLACHEVYYPHPWRNTQGLWLIDIALIPHRSSPSFDREWWDGFHKMYQHQKPYVMLTDIDVLIVNNDQRSIQRSVQHTFESIIWMKKAKRSQ